jgi:hypothetical protein
VKDFSDSFCVFSILELFQKGTANLSNFYFLADSSFLFLAKGSYYSRTK